MRRHRKSSSLHHPTTRVPRDRVRVDVQPRELGDLLVREVVRRHLRDAELLQPREHHRRELARAVLRARAQAVEERLVLLRGLVEHARVDRGSQLVVNKEKKAQERQRLHDVHSKQHTLPDSTRLFAAVIAWMSPVKCLRIAHQCSLCQSPYCVNVISDHVQVELVHRHDLRVATSRSAALDAERRSLRRLRTQ